MNHCPTAKPTSLITRAVRLGLPFALVFGLGLTLSAPATAQQQCRGEKEWYGGKCRYPDEIARMKAAQARIRARARQRAQDKAACDKAKKADTVAAWTEYLDSYPKGQCKEQAERRKRELEAKPVPVPVPTTPPTAVPTAMPKAVPTAVPPNKPTATEEPSTPPPLPPVVPTTATSASPLPPPEPDQERFPPGSYIDRYRIVRVLGSGGMATVYLAEDDELKRPVAVKVPHKRMFGSKADVDILRKEAIAVAKLMIPETEEPETARQQIELPSDDTLNGLDAAAQGASEGIHLAINIVAMLIAFIGLVALANHFVGWIDLLINAEQAGSWSLEAAAGFLFRPFVWLMGISWAEAAQVGELMGMKTILNEFIAYAELASRMQQENPLSERAFIITTYALCGFANFGSVAIMIGGIGGIAPERRGDLARLGLRSIVGGTLATMLTGCIIGIFI